MSGVIGSEMMWGFQRYTALRLRVTLWQHVGHCSRRLCWSHESSQYNTIFFLFFSFHSTVNVLHNVVKQQFCYICVQNSLPSIEPHSRGTVRLWRRVQADLPGLWKSNQVIDSRNTDTCINMPESFHRTLRSWDGSNPKSPFNQLITYTTHSLLAKIQN